MCISTTCSVVHTGTHCDGRVQALLEHGRLRTDQILSLVAGLRASNAQLPEGAIMTCLVNLVHSRYVQRARGCNAERPQKPLPATVKVRASHGLEPSLSDLRCIHKKS